MSETPSRQGEFTASAFTGLLVCNLGWGIGDVCIRLIGHGQAITWIHGITGALFLALMLSFTRTKFSFRDFVKSFPFGLQRAVVWAGLFYAFQTANPAIATTILSFSIVVSIVIFGPLLGEKLNAQILILAAIGTIGIILTSVPSFKNIDLGAGTIICLILLPVSAAGTYILRRSLTQVPEKTNALYMFTWVSILFTPIIPFTHPDLSFTGHEMFLVAALMVAGAGAHFIFAYTHKQTSFRFNAIVSTIQAPATAVLAWWWVGDTLHVHQIVGIFVVTFTVAAVSIVARPKEEPVPHEILVQEP